MSLELRGKLELETQIWQPSGYRGDLKTESEKKITRKKLQLEKKRDGEQGHHQVKENENQLPLRSEGNREGQKPNQKCVSEKQ